MTEIDAINQACNSVGILPPKSYRRGQWAKTDTTSGRNGKGDGRIIVHDHSVTAYNWQTGISQTVPLNEATSFEQRKEVRAQVEDERRERVARAAAAAEIAGRIVAAATPMTHPYLVSKGFPEEKALVLTREKLVDIGGHRLTVPGGGQAIVIPAKIGMRVTSVQMIWEDGTKRFLLAGEMGGASHRISTGANTLLVEGFATGLSVRDALRGLKMQVSVICCFSAANVVNIARQAKSRCFVAADHDKPLDQFGGLGAGEYYAQQSGMPYGMPPIVSTDFNDLHQQDGIFAVQRTLSAIMARRRRA